jgi:predicted metal-dependent phosphoesterase TrpH
MKLLLHIHSNASFDSQSSPRAIAAEAARLGAQAVAVTDHDTIAGSLALAKAAPGLQCIAGAEYKTDCGDIIGLFLNSEIKERRAEDVVAAIHAQGGIVILPHPWHSHTHVKKLARMVDAIEVWNSRCSPEANAKAQILAEETGCSQVAGSDAHFISEMSNALMEFDCEGPLTPDTFLNAPRIWTVKTGRKSLLFWSQAIKAIKQRRFSVAIGAVKGLVGCALRSVFGSKRWDQWKQSLKAQ